MKKISIFILLLSILIKPAYSRDNIRFASLTADDGLAQNHVEAVLQDRQGFMWIGTGGGLSRFDGYDFTNYIHDPGI